MKILTEQGDRTTDAAPIDGARWLVPENSAIRVQILAIARGNQPNTGSATFTRNAVIRRNLDAAPTVEASDNLATVANAAAAGWTITPAFDGNNLVVRLTGGAGVVVDWQSEIDGIIVGPIV